ncbi:cobyrinate a,c-diamide synthase [Desulfuromonas sp. AOP6]|uniref:cobyrinate a,c-diamide synthase n=1 Tax=Desulfuromonas sp. AOP6 TaxID=1566351 RepID=UPI001281052A|nr:cobyrinate a,c-diamide synthase [Desulfuromonas sp. AOP6]BCA79016.1 cobyrinate a,c-diamide synthase [Desulfuromonas sp. AOP6]
MNAIPCLLMAGSQSGVGKSSLTLALVAAFRRRGLRVQTFKVGPDYLDPGHLAHVSGRPCYNLDGWMAGEDYCRSLFADACAKADIAIVEGVMGLFDGSSAESLSGSTAEMASWLKLPVLLVVNAHGMARSIAALVKGYSEFDERVSISGVIANMCGSESHGRWLQQALVAAAAPPLLGTVTRDAFPELPSRHLGLVSAQETDWSAPLIDRLCELAEHAIDLDKLLRQSVTVPPIKASEEKTFPRTAWRGLKLAVARDEAFQFYYADLFDALHGRGVEIQFFSPLDDDSVPLHCDGLYLGGGYPELYGHKLAANEAMRHSIMEFCSSGKPVYAECGGLIYLCREVAVDNEIWPMVGVLPSRARMLQKRKALGYVEATLQVPTLFGAVGTRLRGHEFHYSELCDDPIGKDGWQAAYHLRKNRGAQVRDEGYQKGNILASYAHLHLASQPQALDSWVENMYAAQDTTRSNNEKS